MIVKAIIPREIRIDDSEIKMLHLDSSYEPKQYPPKIWQFALIGGTVYQRIEVNDNSISVCKGMEPIYYRDSCNQIYKCIGSGNMYWKETNCTFD